jgi:uncharacterized repeat protein (TIGR01451 family)
MSLPDVVGLLALYTLMLGVLVGTVHYFTMRRPEDRATGLKIAPLAAVTPVSWPVGGDKQSSPPALRALAHEREPGVQNDPLNPQIQPPRKSSLSTDTLPTFNEVWARAAVRSNEATVERTLSVKELPAQALSPVLLPIDENLLPEGLRTFEVSPNRMVEPGATVYAAFTFRNLGGAAATGFRARFRLPAEFAYVAGTARIDGAPLEDRDGQTPFVQRFGAEIGDIPAGGERRLSLAYRVADIIEDGSQIALQAALASPNVPVIGTNIVRLTVCSSPALQSAQTSLTLSALQKALPGEELRLNARIHNSGQSTAHDVVALLPVPAHTTFVPQSAMVGGRLFTSPAERQPSSSTRRTMTVPTLAPGETIDIGYRVRIDSPLEDATVITAQGAVCSEEVGQFSLPSVSINVASTAAFDSKETAVRLDCANDVKPGELIRIVASAKNVGTALARDLSLALALPDGLSYVAGSLTIDGAPTVDRGTAAGLISLADLAPGETVNLSLSVNVSSPISDGHALHVLSTIAWATGKREFERTVTARSAARFPLNYNKLERQSPYRIAPSDTLGYTLTLRNMGTDIATGVTLQFTADERIERLRLRERDTELELRRDGAVELGAIKPGMSRSLHIDGQVAGVIEDQAQLRLAAALSTTQTARVELGAAVHVVDSAPAFSAASSRIIVDNAEPLQQRDLVRARLIVMNAGTDRGRAVNVAMQLPDELKLEFVNGEACNDGAVEFGDIPAGETREADLRLRLVGDVAGDRLRIGGRLSAANVMAVTLSPIELETHAEPSFEGTTLRSVPPVSVDAGAEITYTLAMRNSGNGTARRLTARLTTISDAVYAHASTTVNGIALQDNAGTSLLLSRDGLTLADVAPGVEAMVRWRAIVNTPLPPSTIIHSTVSVQWDDAPEMLVSSEPLRVESTSAMPVFEPSLPFSILGAVAAAKGTTIAVASPGSMQPIGGALEGHPPLARRAG